MISLDPTAQFGPGHARVVALDLHSEWVMVSGGVRSDPIASVQLCEFAQDLHCIALQWLQRISKLNMEVTAIQ